MPEAQDCFQEYRSVITGYEVSNNVTVLVRDLQNVDRVIDEAVDAGGDYIRFNGLSFSLEDTSVLQSEARAAAVSNLEEKAANWPSWQEYNWAISYTLASLAGQRLRCSRRIRKGPGGLRGGQRGLHPDIPRGSLYFGECGWAVSDFDPGVANSSEASLVRSLRKAVAIYTMPCGAKSKHLSPYLPAKLGSQKRDPDHQFRPLASSGLHDSLEKATAELERISWCDCPG